MTVERDPARPEDQPVRFLNVPDAKRAHYRRNFIRSAVCELRFPTIFEIEDDKPPVDFWKALRGSFPKHDMVNNLQLGPSSLNQARFHRFQSKGSRWAVSLKPSAVTLETAEYDSYDDFREQLEKVFNATNRLIDSDFYTRVGLRYVNELPCDASDVGGWVNHSLVGPYADGVFGDAEVFRTQVSGKTDIGAFNFIIGVGAAVALGRNAPGFVLDLDFYREEVPIQEVLGTVDRLKQLEFSLFTWALGEKAKDELSGGKK